MSRLTPTLSWFEESIIKLGNTMPPPARQQRLDGNAYRYSERTAQQAAYVKLTRYVSGLAAGRLLATNGFFQELAVLQRTLDEIHEDILYLTIPFYGIEKPVDYLRYLEIFWEEEPEFKEFAAHQKNRDQVPRKKIRNYISQDMNSMSLDPQGSTDSKYLSRLLSGYVHSAAPQCMELYDPDQGIFRVLGYPDSPLSEDHFDDFENQFFRGVLSVVFVAHALGASAIEEESQKLHRVLIPYFTV